MRDWDYIAALSIVAVFAVYSFYMCFISHQKREKDEKLTSFSSITHFLYGLGFTTFLIAIWISGWLGALLGLVYLGCVIATLYFNKKAQLE